MPMYRFRCADCGDVQDVFRKLSQFDDIPMHCDDEMKRVITAPYVMPDIAAYQAIAVDKATGKPPVINSRRQHREFLRRNGYIELGNEKPKSQVSMLDSPREELARVTKQVLSR
jgi:putative FmdB family regulatory protein